MGKIFYFLKIYILCTSNIAILVFNSLYSTNLLIIKYIELCSYFARYNLNDVPWSITFFYIIIKKNNNFSII